MKSSIFRFVFWRLILAGLVLGGFYALYVRATAGLGAATLLDDQFPWGLVIGLNVICGLSLAAGGFTSAAAVQLMHERSLRPIFRAAIITAFLGFLLAIPALLFDLGAPRRAWALLIGGWSTRHALSGALWCLILYAAVLAGEFLPLVFPAVRQKLMGRWARMIPQPLLMTAVVLSIVHLYSLTRVFLLAQERRSPLWQTDFLPVLLLLSGLWAILALVIFASWHTRRALGRRISRQLEVRVSGVMGQLLGVYLMVRVLDLGVRGALPMLLESNQGTVLLGVEFSLLALPTILLLGPGRRHGPDAVFACSALALAGFMASLLNVTITSVEVELNAPYFPAWTEVLFSYSLIATGVGLFYLAAKYLPVFEPEPLRG